jgi:hypothetical protein
VISCRLSRAHRSHLSTAAEHTRPIDEHHEAPGSFNLAPSSLPHPMSSSSRSPVNQPALPQPHHQQPRRLEGRIAIVTGSSSGLGRAIALALASHGASVFCIDLYPAPRSNTSTSSNALTPTTSRTTDDMHVRSYEPGTHERIRQLGGEAVYHKADVTKARDMDLAVRAVSLHDFSPSHGTKGR